MHPQVDAFLHADSNIWSYVEPEDNGVRYLKIPLDLL